MPDSFSRNPQSTETVKPEGAAQNKSRTSLKKWLRLVIGLLLITWLVSKADWGQMWQHLRQAQSSLVFAAALIFGASRFVEALRLYSLCKGTRVTLSDATRMLFASMFFNNLSTSLVGDGYKAVYITRTGARLAEAVGIVLLDRIIGLAGFVAVACVLLTGQRERREHLFGPFFERDAIFTSVAMLMLLALMVASGLAFLALATGRLARTTERIQSLIGAMTKTLVNLGIWRLSLALLLSLLSHVGVALTFTELARAFGEVLSLVDAVLIVCVVMMATYLPITLGSLGVREGIIIVGLQACGLSNSVATAVALLSRALIYAYALLGGAMLLRRQKNNEH